jgi:ribosomal-protein-alanine N-acetyltransferase
MCAAKSVLYSAQAQGTEVVSATSPMAAFEIVSPTTADAALLADFYRQNHAHFQPFEPLRPADFYTEPALLQRLAAQQQLQQQRLCYALIARTEQQIVAQATLSQIIYGPFCAGYLGFGVAKAFEGQGLMTELCRQLIRHAFTELQLNRIMANYLPSNQRSARLLQRLGFEVEGRARHYLQINGQWQDHILTALLHPKYANSTASIIADDCAGAEQCN